MAGAKTVLLDAKLQGDMDCAGFRLLNLDLSGLATGAPFYDDTALIRAAGDATKLARFNISANTAGQQRVFTLPNYDGQVATLAGAEAITGKTLLGIRSSLAAFDLRLASAEGLTGNRTLTLYTDDADRNFQLGGDVVFADDFNTLGAFPITLTATGSTGLTLPTSGTVATTAQIPVISDVAYNATTWNGNLDGATKNAIRDKFESFFVGSNLPPFDDDKDLVRATGDATKILKINVSGLTTATTRTLTVQNKNGTIACLDDIPDVNGILFEADQPDRTLYLAGNVAFFGAFTLEGGHDVTLHTGGVTNLTLPYGEETLATLAGEETLTNKTINGGEANALEQLSIRSTGAAFNLGFETAAVLTSNRKLILALGDANRTLTLGGNLFTFGNFTALGTVNIVNDFTTGGTFSTFSDFTVGASFETVGIVNLADDLVTAGAFTTIGAFPIELTATASTALTLPTSGTLASFVLGKMDIAGTAASITAGAGSPEGVVSAARGSLFLNTAGGAAVSLYVKEGGGTGATGWVAK